MLSPSGGDNLDSRVVERKNSLTRESQDFLNDFALFVSGPGGPDNVSAVCIETSDRDDQILVLRVARNGGLSDEMLCGLSGTIRSVTESITAGMSEDHRREETLLKIIRRCRSRIVKHTKALERMLRFVHGHSSNQFNAPQFAFHGDRAESLQDIKLFGKYGEATHESYMRTCQNRLKQFKELAFKISLSTTPAELQYLVALTKLAYQVRRSFSFKQLVEHNISKSEKPGTPVPEVRDIVERVGQISKFYRAAGTLTTYMAKLLKLGKRIEIKATPTERIKISELACRTAAEVRRRGGHRFTSSGEKQIQDMMNRWPTYREHVELQLIIFYEQNPRLTLFSPYIGCNKRSCYLCYNFIAEHGRFQVDGCHQSLYSLWTVRETISFADEERAGTFKRALKNLCFDLEQKIEAQKGLQWQRPRFRTHNESVANLSRVSLALNDRTILEPSFEKRADNAAAIPAVTCVRGIPTRLSSTVSSLANLRPVPEEAPEGFTETRMNCEPLRENAILPDESVDIAHGDSYSQVEKDVVARQPDLHIELVAVTASTQADIPDPAQGFRSSLVASPLLTASPAGCSKDISKNSEEPPAPNRPRKRHRQRRNLSHQSRHSRPVQHDSRVSGRSNKADCPTLYRAVTKKGRNRRVKTPKERESSSSQPRVMYGRRRKPRSSFKHTLIGIVKVVLAIFGGMGGQKTKRSWR